MIYNINPSELYTLIYQDALFIDIRDTDQFQYLHIQNFINIPYTHFYAQLPFLPKNKPIYVICYSGKKSQDIVQLLRQYGYNAYYIEGGFHAFLAETNKKYF